jgi:hypothetical protein
MGRRFAILIELVTQYATRTRLDLSKGLHVLASACSKSHVSIYARIFGEHSAPANCHRPAASAPVGIPAGGGLFSALRSEPLPTVIWELESSAWSECRAALPILANATPIRFSHGHTCCPVCSE